MKKATLKERVAILEKVVLGMARSERRDLQCFEKLINDFSVTALAMMLCKQKIADSYVGPPN